MNMDRHFHKYPYKPKPCYLGVQELCSLAGLISETEKLQPGNIQHTQVLLDTSNMQVSGVTLSRREFH